MHYKKVALFLKEDKPWANEVIFYTKELFTNVSIFSGTVGTPLPETALDAYDLVLSYLSPWILPCELLEKTVAAINFHPGPPEYPGIGCFNFAIYDGVPTYGVTCHHMLPKVDTGSVISVSSFPVRKDESVLSLSLKSYAHMYALYVNILDLLYEGDCLPVSETQWTRPPYKRKDLNALCRIDEYMEQAEVERRIRATSYPNAPGAYMVIAGKIFAHCADDSLWKR